MALRLIGTDDANPRLPVAVINATQGPNHADLAPGDVGVLALFEANAYTDQAIADVVAGGIDFADGAETLAGTSTVKAVNPAGLAVERPYLDVRSFGATGDGTTDDTTAITAAITAAANTAIVVVPPGTYRLTAQVTVPSGVDLRATGTSGQKVSTTATGTTFTCQGAGQIVFEGGGAESGGFRCVGSSNSGPLVVFGHGCNSRTFTAITAASSAQDSFALLGAQNCAFISLYSEFAAGNALVIDTRPADGLGAAGNRFYSFESGGVNGWHIVVRATTGGGAAPGNNWMFGGICERSTGDTGLAGFVDLAAGDLDLVGWTGSVAAGPVSTAGIRVAGSALLRLHGNCNLNSTAGETNPGVLQTGTATTAVYGRLVIRNWTTAWQHNGGPIQILGEVVYSAVTNRWAFSGGSLNTILARLSRPVAVTGLETNDGRVIEGYVVGEANPRVRLGPDRLLFGPGGATTPSQFAELIKQTTTAATATLTVFPTLSTLNTITAQNQALTIAAPSTGALDGQRITLRILDNGTARALTWNAAWVPIGVTLPTTTVANKWLFVEARFYETGNVWHVYNVRVQA